MSPLERRYRRLLALYPRCWRTRRLEEVLAVVLECEPSRDWPAPRDAFDLVRHAIAERVRVAGRSASRDDRRRGVALAGIVALALLVALSVVQLIALVPSSSDWVWSGPAFLTATVAATLACACSLLAAALWLVRLRRASIAAIGLADAGFLLGTLWLRGAPLLEPWTLMIAVLGLAALATVLLARPGLSDAGHELIGARGAAELVGALLLAAQAEGWHEILWAANVSGYGLGNPAFHAIPHAAVLALTAAAGLALVVAASNPVPLIAVTTLSPLLLAGPLAALARADVFGNAGATFRLADDGAPLLAVALLALASALATRRRQAAS